MAAHLASAAVNCDIVCRKSVRKCLLKSIYDYNFLVFYMCTWVFYIPNFLMYHMHIVSNYIPWEIHLVFICSALELRRHFSFHKSSQFIRRSCWLYYQNGCRSWHCVCTPLTDPINIINFAINCGLGHSSILITDFSFIFVWLYSSSYLSNHGFCSKSDFP